MDNNNEFKLYLIGVITMIVIFTLIAFLSKSPVKQEPSQDIYDAKIACPKGIKSYEKKWLAMAERYEYYISCK